MSGSRTQESRLRRLKQEQMTMAKAHQKLALEPLRQPTKEE